MNTLDLSWFTQHKGLRPVLGYTKIFNYQSASILMDSSYKYYQGFPPQVFSRASPKSIIKGDVL